MKKQSRIAIGIWILILTLTGMILRAQGAEKPVNTNTDMDTDTIELTNYVTYLFRNMRPKFLNRALEYIPIVVKECREQNWDPLLVGLIIKKESSWRSGIVSKSPLAEKGLMQLHGKAAKGWDLDDPYQEIKAGVTWLTECRVICGDNLGRILSCYGTGRCNKQDLPAIQSRLRAYKRIVRKFRIIERKPQ